MSKNSKVANRPALAVAKKTVGKEQLEALRQANTALTESKIILANADLVEAQAVANHAAALANSQAAVVAFEEAAANATRSFGGDPNDPKQKWNIQLDSGVAERIL